MLYKKIEKAIKNYQMGTKQKTNILITLFIGFLLFSIDIDAQTVNKYNIVIQVNAVRKKGCNCGGRYYQPVQAIKWNDKLEAAAKLHSDYMNSVEDMTHYDASGKNFTNRLKKVGYYWSCGAENIAWNYDETEIIDAWINSPGHCINIMGRNYTEIGVARTGQYWTMVLAAPDNKGIKIFSFKQKFKPTEILIK